MVIKDKELKKVWDEIIKPDVTEIYFDPQYPNTSRPVFAIQKKDGKLKLKHYVGWIFDEYLWEEIATIETFEDFQNVNFDAYGRGL